MYSVHSKKSLQKWIYSSSAGHLGDYSLKIVNWVRSQRSNERLIFVKNIEVGFVPIYYISEKY